MNRQLLNEYAAVPQPAQGQAHFINALKAPKREYFSDDEKCSGVTVAFQGGSLVPETALSSLYRVLKAKNVTVGSEGIPVKFSVEPDWDKEEFEVSASENGVEIKGADEDGLRRAVYFWEDRIRECAGRLCSYGKWHKKAKLKIRISRCFFGPTGRPPFFIDELMNDVDYGGERDISDIIYFATALPSGG